MIKRKLVFMFGLFIVSGIPAMDGPPLTSIEEAPNDIKRLIVEKLIERDAGLENNDLSDFNRTLTNIRNYSLLSKNFREFINDPDNMVWLVKTLARVFHDRLVLKATVQGELNFPLDELFIAKGFANMPAVKSDTFKREIFAPEELRVAAVAYNVKKVKELIAQGVNVNATDGKGQTALHRLVTSQVVSPKGFAVMLKILMDAGANINAQDKLGNTPILLATMLGRSSFMEEILKYNPDVTLAETTFGQTPFHYAAASVPVEPMNLLLAYVKRRRIVLSSEIKEMVEIRTLMESLNE